MTAENGKTTIIPFLFSLMFLLASLGSGLLKNKWDREANIDLKKYEVTFLKKRGSYSNFLRALSDLYFLTFNSKENDFIRTIDIVKSENDFMEPFLYTYSDQVRQDLREKTQEFISFCRKAKETDMQSGTQAAEMNKRFASYKDQFQKQIYRLLFTDNQEAL